MSFPYKKSGKRSFQNAKTILMEALDNLAVDILVDSVGIYRCLLLKESKRSKTWQ
jgi:hypothetical protein